jgi:hypothetical protein
MLDYLTRTTDHTFNKTMEQLVELYGPKHFKGGRRSSIRFIAKKFTNEQWEKIVEETMCEHRWAPLPKDFRETAKRLKNSYFLKSDQNASQHYGEHERAEVDCLWCFDTGICKATDEVVSHLVLCGCEAEVTHSKAGYLPDLEDDRLRAWKRVKLNPKAFIPQSGQTVWGSAKRWTEAIELSVIYWESKL